MSQHRSPGGHTRSAVVVKALERTNDDTRSGRGAHRIPAPPPALRGRVVVAAVALGAIAAAAAGQTLKGSSSSGDDITPMDGAAAFGIGGDSTASPEVLTVAHTTDGGLEAQKFSKSAQMMATRTAQDNAAKAQADAPKYVKPAQGVFTSGFAYRWGTWHYGVDIAGEYGSPEVAVEDGVVIEAGPASGFGLWVRIQHPDGYISVYGHMDSITTHEGAHVKAGEQIARMGNRGQSTGTHLHFEIWDPTGKKIDPRPWLAARGITL